MERKTEKGTQMWIERQYQELSKEVLAEIQKHTAENFQTLMDSFESKTDFISSLTSSNDFLKSFGLTDEQILSLYSNILKQTAQISSEASQFEIIPNTPEKGIVGANTVFQYTDDLGGFYFNAVVDPAQKGGQKTYAKITDIQSDAVGKKVGDCFTVGGYNGFGGTQYRISNIWDSEEFYDLLTKPDPKTNASVRPLLRENVVLVGRDSEYSNCYLLIQLKAVDEHLSKKTKKAFHEVEQSEPFKELRNVEMTPGYIFKANDYLETGTIYVNPNENAHFGREIEVLNTLAPDTFLERFCTGPKLDDTLDAKKAPQKTLIKK